MMKLKNKLLLTVLLISTLLSCKKLIEIEDEDFIKDTNAFQTVENVEQGVIGAYAGMVPEMGYLLNSTFSDEVKTAGEFYNSISTHEWQYGPEDVTIRDNFTAMANFYAVIDRANRILQAVDNADSTRPGDPALKPRLKGEALFIRAFAHFELARFYTGNYTADGLAMPFQTEVYTVPSKTPIAREKMSTYYQKIIADMTEAKNLLPALTGTSDKFRATKIAVVGLQARVALYMNDWANAITYSTEYINAIPLSPRANFTGIWTDANTEEVAFKLDRSNTFNPYNRLGSLYRGTSASASGNGIGVVLWSPSDKLWNSYDATNDIRFTAYLKSEPILAAVGRPSRLVNKYAGTAYGTSGENVADVKVFRTGEMYLIRAEARAETGAITGANSAESDVNALRAARITGYTPVVFTSKQQAIDEIMLERFKELAFEGHRFWDLRRKGLPVVRIGTDAPSATGATLPAGSFRFLLPIPRRELQANPLMVQNPGY
ncbi:MAG TPA: RagB/SusD family nutrient uptake outer membrane protein [Chitinophagaceae bacterium]